jgi:hypothetical protein
MKAITLFKDERFSNESQIAFANRTVEFVNGKNLTK